ncbi:MAG: phosphatase PAP2 family protein [Woeseiaceae bacterium]|nr:phosphatase PAP2 family protein [Woeseiaceae bacterium]
MSALINYFDNHEIKLCLRVNRLSRARGVRPFFTAVSKAGDGGCWIFLAVACLLSGRDDAPLFVARALATAVAGIALYRVLKNRLVRERPYITNAGIICGTAPLDRYSFPSGHTLHAVSFTILFTAFDPWLAFIVVPLALLIAVSRVVLGLHYPSDVIAGAVIGSILATTALTV